MHSASAHGRACADILRNSSKWMRLCLCCGANAAGDAEIIYTSCVGDVLRARVPPCSRLRTLSCHRSTTLPHAAPHANRDNDSQMPRAYSSTGATPRNFMDHSANMRKDAHIYLATPPASAGRKLQSASVPPVVTVSPCAYDSARLQNSFRATSSSHARVLLVLVLANLTLSHAASSALHISCRSLGRSSETCGPTPRWHPKLST